MRVNVEPLLAGPIFLPLLSPGFFAKARLDEEAGTVVWPNGADFAPEALYEIAERRAGERGSAAVKKRAEA